MSFSEWILNKKITQKGGEGSGNFNHAGRPGEIGGSAPEGGITALGSGTSQGAERFVNDIVDNYAEKDPDFNSWINGEYQESKVSAYHAIEQLNNSIKEELDANYIGDINANRIINEGLPGYDGNNNIAEGLGNSNLAELQKDEIMRKLSKDSGASYNDVNNLVGQWAYSSNDTSYRSLSLQEAVSEEFGVELSEFQKQSINSLKPTEEPNDIYQTPVASREIERKVLRTMYDNTQEYLKNLGFKPDDTITLYRGFDDEEANKKFISIVDGFIDKDKRREAIINGSTIHYKGNSSESWSSSPHTASTFGSIVIAINVPIKNILSTARTGWGCLNECEMVLMGNNNVDVTLVNYPLSGGVEEGY